MCAELAGRKGAVLALHEVEGFRGLHDASQARTLTLSLQPIPNPQPTAKP